MAKAIIDVIFRAVSNNDQLKLCISQRQMVVLQVIPTLCSIDGCFSRTQVRHCAIHNKAVTQPLQKHLYTVDIQALWS